MRPGIAEYPSFQKRGRHGSVRDSNAVGRRCTKAVAMSTPVPKCRDRKRNWWGTGTPGKRLTMTGNEHASAAQISTHVQPAVEETCTYPRCSAQVSGPERRHAAVCYSVPSLPSSHMLAAPAHLAVFGVARLEVDALGSPYTKNLYAHTTVSNCKARCHELNSFRATRLPDCVPPPWRQWMPRIFTFCRGGVPGVPGARDEYRIGAALFHYPTQARLISQYVSISQSPSLKQQ